MELPPGLCGTCHPGVRRAPSCSLTLLPAPSSPSPHWCRSHLPEQQVGPEEQRLAVLLQEQFLFELALHLQEAACQQEAARSEILEKEAKIQKLQETIAKLHYEISQKDLEAVRELPDTDRLESEECGVQQRQRQEPAVPAAQEQRICELETLQREAQTELGQRRHQSQHVEDRQPGQEYQEDPCQQLTIQAEGESKVLRGCRWAHRVEAQGATAQLAVAETDAAALRSKYRLALKEAAERNRALHNLQESHGLLQQRMAKREALFRPLESQVQEQLASLQSAQEEGTLSASRAKQEAAESQVCAQEEEIEALRRKGHLIGQQLEERQGEVDQQKELLSTEQRKYQVLREELQKRDQELSALREALQPTEQQQSKQQPEQRWKADIQATQDQLSQCQEQLSAEQAKHQRLAQDGASLRDQHKAFQERLAGKETEVSDLQTRLLHLQDKLWGPRESQHEQGQRMVEQTRVVHQLQHEKEASLGQSPSTVALREQLRERRGSFPVAHQADMEELQVKLQHLQQELDICKGRNQENLSKLQARECTLEKQSLDLDHLLHQCQILKDQLFYYEEVTEKQELALSHQQERERHLQDRLAQAESSAGLLEESLDIYKQKYQASLTRAGELESRLQRLEEELASQAKAREEAILKLQAEKLVWQEELEGKCHQANDAEEAMERLVQELHNSQRELSQGRLQACQFEETIQGLQEALSDSRAKVLDQEEVLATLRRDFASYKSTHSYSNSSYESQVLHTKTFEQKLQEAEKEITEHQQKAEEYQNLLQDLKMELVRVVEQKSSALKGLARLELTVQSLRQEAAAERERQEAEAATRQQQAQQLELALGRSRQSCAQQEQAIQKRDELLRKSQAELVRARSALQEKSQELEQQRGRAHRLEIGLREAQEALEDNQAEDAALRTETQTLRQSLRETQERHHQAAQELARQEEQLLLAQNSLRAAQEQMEERVAEVVHHAQAAHQLEAEVQVLSKRASRAEEELEQKRELLEHLTEELSQARQQHQAAAQEAQQQRQEVTRLEQKLESSREGLRDLRQQVGGLHPGGTGMACWQRWLRWRKTEGRLCLQVQGHESTLEELRAELSQQRQQEEELQRQRHEAQVRESQLAQCHKDLQRRLQNSQCQLQEEEWKNQGLQSCVAEREAESRALREQLKQQDLELEAARSSLESVQLQLQQQTTEALHWESALSQLRTEFHTVQERERQNCQASQREVVEKLEQKAREASCMEAELQLAQHKVVHLEEQVARTQEQLQEQMAAQRVQEQEACCAEERLRELGSQAQYWQKQSQATQLALEEKDEELVVTKVELAAMEERCRSMAEEREELQNEANLLRQKFVVSNREVESLQTSLEAARSDNCRLQHESELVMANVSQWVKEQKQVNEKLGQKIRDQIKQTAQLTGERDHLQGLTERLEQENKRLKNEVDERRIECERLKGCPPFCLGPDPLLRRSAVERCTSP
ncbi:polyamine-modulated factor 1-binding protein 1 isoform X2 [Sceloporus undulatus]|uniref:polyamine-modulated factor 1-binding protein 1 isoform X2 n=1 Tax=Sceloporus undulatus TaxID=8520 RepID=UPI001C4D4DF5|nr:polyamine-modulated factor 1-binding protein 1 isoform X2 [Sceloporus undulatus]